MRKRANVIALAVVLAVLSFAYGRYRYVDRHSATLTNPFDQSESTEVANPFMDRDLFGDWIKHELVFAVILPVIFLAGGAAWAIRK